jgi:hypothetical protein
VVAAVAAEHAAAAVDDLPRPLARAAVAREERRAARAGEEAEVLRVGLRGDGQLRLGGQRAHLRLGQLAEREAHPRDRLGSQPAQHVGLVLGRVGRRAQEAVRAAAGVVAGRELGGAEAAGEVEHGVEAHVAVAAHARVGRQPVRVLVEPRGHDARAELLAQVEREVRQAHPVRQ